MTFGTVSPIYRCWTYPTGRNDNGISLPAYEDCGGREVGEPPFSF